MPFSNIAKLDRLILSATLGMGLLVSCGSQNDATTEEKTGQATKVQEITPTIAVAPTVPTLGAGEESKVVITGSFGGEAISMTWDFRDPTPKRKCNGVETALTNGAMELMVSSSSSKPAVSLMMESDWGSQNCAMKDSDWLVRFWIGTLNSSTTYANAKETFAIPDHAYTMITVQKGASGTNARRHLENDATNTALTAKVESLVYDAAAKTLRATGGAQGTWSNGDHIEINFNVLVNGSNDRNKNGTSVKYAGDQGAY